MIGGTPQARLGNRRIVASSRSSAVKKEVNGLEIAPMLHSFRPTFERAEGHEHPSRRKTQTRQRSDAIESSSGARAYPSRVGWLKCCIAWTGILLLAANR